MRVPLRPVECVLVVALLAGGAWLRWTHLATPSLWYDELVHIRTAEKPTVTDVWRAARDGAVPSSGNAGAVPLDYLALHAWTRVAPAPTADNLERHYRMPAFLFAVAALPLMWAVARSVAGPVAGVVALALLATSLPHVLYAAEARFYSLYVLATLANLAAFAALVRAPSIARMLVFTLASMAFALSALYGVFPIAAEYLVLTTLAARARDRRALLAIGASGVAAAGIVVAWIAPSLATVYTRGAPVMLESWPALVDTLAFFAGGTWPVALVFGGALATVAFVGRDRMSGALAAVGLLSLCALPAMVAIAHWKHYYYHPRHALFLLPMAHLATAVVAARLLSTRMRAPVAGMFVGVVAVLALSASAVDAYVAAPLEFFARTKTHRDFRGLARMIAERTGGQRPTERLLVLLEKRKPGQLANPTLAFYLDKYGAIDRVLLAGIGDPQPVLQNLRPVCATRCRGPLDVEVALLFGLRTPFNQPQSVRRFLDLRTPTLGPELAGAVVVAWAPNIPTTIPSGIVGTPFDGAMLYELAEP